MTLRIGVSGDVGSFSEQAAIHYASFSKLKCEIHYLIDMENVLAALDSNVIDTGIFPVYNNRGGIVTQAFEAMGNHLFTYLTSFPLEIEQCLITKSDIAFEQITEVVSHPQGLAQCAQFIAMHLPNANSKKAEDTALAARDLAAGKYGETTAVIASAGCAEHYSLFLKKTAIQDVTPNITTFIVVTNETHHEKLPELRKDIDKIDTQIIKKLAQREKIAKKIGDVKKSSGAKIKDTAREKKLEKLYETLSEEYGLSASFVKKIFKLIIMNSRNIQKT